MDLFKQKFTIKKIIFVIIYFLDYTHGLENYELRDQIDNNIIPIATTNVTKTDYPFNNQNARSNRKQFNYLCPQDFIRLSNKCYYLSKTPASWMEAYHKCRDLNSELAVVDKLHEDRHLKHILVRNINHNDRWIGGIFNGQLWTWGKSGKPFTYNGFPKKPQDVKGQGILYCVAMNANKKYRWTAKNCVDQSLFICQTNQTRILNRNRWKNKTKINRNEIIRQLPHKPLKARKPYENYASNTFSNDNSYKNPSNQLQNDVASQPQAAFTQPPSETQKRLKLLARVKRRCQNRDANVLKYVNSTMSERDCIDFFIEKWHKRQDQSRRRIRTKKDKRQHVFGDTITPKTIYKFSYDELRPVLIEESHGV